jgi:protein-tyrosine kinase
MSKLQKALGKMQDGTARTDTGGGRRSQPDAVVPMARGRLADLEGEKHHVDQDSLIERGILPPKDFADQVGNEFRRIKRPLIDNFFKLGDHSADHLNIIMVTSAFPGAGKTFCAMNLAASISLERELSVLLIDADVAKPHISDALGLGERPGLIELLQDDALSIEDVLVRTDLNNMQVLPAGRPDSQSTELLASERMALLMDELARRYSDRIIIMDSPPLLVTSESQSIARQAGQIAFIVESGRTTEQEISASFEILDPDKAINLVLNKSLYSQVGGYYGGTYGSYGFTTDE